MKRKVTLTDSQAEKLEARLSRLTSKATGRGMTASEVRASRSIIAKLKAAGRFNPGKPGSAFRRCVAAVRKSGSAYSPEGVCATEGRKKYGAAKFQRMAAEGRRRAIRKHQPGTKDAKLRRLYAAAEKADERFQRALDASGQNRYSAKLTGPAAAARRRKVAADSRLTRAMRSNAGKRSSKRKRKNPEEAAAERYEFFHGHAPESVVDVETPVHRHGVVSGIGKLVSLKIRSVHGGTVTLGFDKQTYLAQNEDGTQLFIKGGDQSVKLSDFGIKHPHENELLGDALEVDYFTRKDHLRPEDGGQAVYHHRFKPAYPAVVYDVRNRLLHFAGGTYDLPEVGIRG